VIARPSPPRPWAIRAGVLLLASAQMACGATSPSGMTAPLGDGAFQLSISGDTVKCGDTKVPQAGTLIYLNLTGTHDASGTWIGRAASVADGSIEMRVSRGGGSATAPSGPLGPLDTVVTGTWTGVANDSLKFTPTQIDSGRTATFDGAVAFTGIIRSTGRFGDGYSSGPITFSRAGVSATCPAGAASWTLNGPF